MALVHGFQLPKGRRERYWKIQSYLSASISDHGEIVRLRQPACGAASAQAYLVIVKTGCIKFLKHLRDPTNIANICAYGAFEMVFIGKEISLPSRATVT